MKQSVVFLFFLMLVSGMASAKLPVVVSIQPQKTFTEAIGGAYVSVEVMVLPGNSPHTYEPKPSQMKQIAHARLYLALGVEFEQVWLPKFRDLNPTLHIVDVSEGIPRRPMREKHTAKSGALDPHIWTAPIHVRRIAHNTLVALQQADPAHAEAYARNYQEFVRRIDATDAQLHALLDPLKGSAFMVQHPSWGYWADAYGLEQLPMNIAGKSPKPRELVALIRQARARHVRAVFTQPETSDTLARVLARELHIPVVRISPMARDWSANLLRLGRAVAGKPEQP